MAMDILHSEVGSRGKEGRKGAKEVKCSMEGRKEGFKERQEGFQRSRSSKEGRREGRVRRKGGRKRSQEGWQLVGEEGGGQMS
jgi:hypothetical protein